MKRKILGSATMGLDVIGWDGPWNLLLQKCLPTNQTGQGDARIECPSPGKCGKVRGKMQVAGRREEPRCFALFFLTTPPLSFFQGK